MQATTQEQESLQPSSRLLALPVEVRRFILEYALFSDIPTMRQVVWDERFYCDIKAPMEGRCGLLTTNKQVAAELLDVVYRKTTLHISLAFGGLDEDLGLGEHDIAPDNSLKIFRNALKNFQHIVLAPTPQMARMLDGLRITLRYICDVYEGPGRTLTIELILVSGNASWITRIFDVLKEHSGKSTKIAIKAFFESREEKGRSMVESFCAKHDFSFISGKT